MLDEELESWRSRPLGKLAYLIIDARYLDEEWQTGKTYLNTETD